MSANDIELAELKLMSLGISQEAAQQIGLDYGLDGLDRAYQFALMGDDLPRISALLAAGVSVEAECLARQALLGVELAIMRDKNKETPT